MTIAESFEQWWAETMEPGFSEVVPVLMLSYKEIAQQAWVLAWQKGFAMGYGTY